MEILFEIPNLKDFKRVNELAVQVHEIHVNWNPDLFKSVKEVISKEEFENRIKNEEIFVAKKEKEIIGYVIFNIKEKEVPSMRYRKQLNIEVIKKKKKHRGKGFGTKILKGIKEIAKSKGCTDLYLTVNKENENAISVYEKFGFEVKNIAYMMKL